MNTVHCLSVTQGANKIQQAGIHVTRNEH